MVNNYTIQLSGNGIKFTICLIFILMTTQIVAIEGMTISPVKVGGMTLSFLFFVYLLPYTKDNYKIVLLTGIYLITLTCCSLLSSSTFVWSRIIYRGMFLLTFICYYQILSANNLPIVFFHKLFIFIICSYGICFLLQHICFAIGIKELLLINQTGAMTMDGALKANGLAIEPSHSARILTFVYWGVIKLTELQNDNKDLSLYKHFQLNPWTTISFWGSMLMMGSTTAMLGVFLILLHFFKKKLGYYLLGITIVTIFFTIDFNIETINRLKIVINSFFSDDIVNTLKTEESSGGSRIAPIINTLIDMDLFSADTWIGKGSDNIRTNAAMFTTQKIGDINDFGLLSYIVSLIFVFKFCIRKILCLETLLFAILLGGAIGSIYTCWGSMMVCTTIKHFESKFINK